MTPKQQLLIEYVWKLQGQMQLQEWRVYIQNEPPEPEGDQSVRARIQIFRNGSAEAWLQVADSFWRLSPDSQRETVIHELLHVMHHDLRLAAEATSWTDYVPHEAAFMAREMIDRAEERVVDRLTRVISEDFALPPVDKPGWESGGGW